MMNTMCGLNLSSLVCFHFYRSSFFLLSASGPGLLLFGSDRSPSSVADTNPTIISQWAQISSTGSTTTISGGPDPNPGPVWAYLFNYFVYLHPLTTMGP